MKLEISDGELCVFRDLIRERSGIYLEGSYLDTLKAGLCTRMETIGFSNSSRYYNFLRFHPEGQCELEKLLPYVTVNETYFFRNALHFEALRDHILAKLTRENRNGVIKIWSAGCSTGEEPYSIAMAVLDIIQDGKDIQTEILGTDLDKEAISKAIQGSYKKRSLRAMEDKYKDRYFSVNDSRIEIDKRLKDMVQFSCFNLMDATYPKPSQGCWDIIFCRNVIIYLDGGSARYVTDMFEKVLDDNGYLFLGDSETLDGLSDAFSPVNIGDTFVYVKKRNDAVITKDEKRAIGIAKISQKKTSGHKQYKANFAKQGDRLKKPETLHQTKDEESKQEDVRSYLLAGKNYANQGAYERAVDELKKSVKLDPLLMESHYLLGVTYQTLGQISKAIEEYKRCVFIDRDCALPHFNLACVYRSSNMREDAMREYRSAFIMLEKLRDDEIVQFSDGITVGMLKQLCLKNIMELSY